MAIRGWFGSLVLASVLVAPVVAQADPGQLYVRVTTMHGDVHEGFLRWDKNEGHGTDVLDAAKRIPRRFLREAEELGGPRAPGRRSVSVLGIDIRVSDDGTLPQRSSGLRMGHISKLHVLDDEHALVTLHSGVEQELRRSSTDLGPSNQGIEIHHPDRDRVIEVEWDDIDFVEFLPAPRGVRSPLGQRLYGVLETDEGQEFTGWITWDMDEIYTGDVLDGDARGEGRQKIPFGEIARIEAVSSSRAEVTLKNGESVTLGGTNDVNSGNRGIAVGDPGLGQIRLDWGDFRAVTFTDPPGAAPTFDGGRRLEGTVRTRDGETHRGTLRWDNDEAWAWEILDGESNGIEMKVEFGLVASIERESSQSARVTLRDGRTFAMRGSNDVGDSNSGIIVELDDGNRVRVRWREFERVDFVR